MYLYEWNGAEQKQKLKIFWIINAKNNNRQIRVCFNSHAMWEYTIHKEFFYLVTHMHKNLWHIEGDIVTNKYQVEQSYLKLK